jgi:hypothetical protein
MRPATNAHADGHIEEHLPSQHNTWHVITNNVRIRIICTIMIIIVIVIISMPSSAVILRWAPRRAPLHRTNLRVRGVLWV